MRRLPLHGLAAIVVAGFSLTIAHAKTKPTPCPPGEFLLDAPAAAALSTLLGAAVASLQIDDAGGVRLGECATTGRVKAKRKATKVSASWAGCGAATKLRMKGTERAPACALLAGTFRVKAGKSKKVRFSAVRAFTTTTTTPGSSSTSTSLPPPPPGCGNGIVDGTDQCEGAAGCGAGQACTAACTCAPLDAPPPTSQSLLAAALARGDIDVPTSLVYRAWALFGDGRLPPEYDGEAWQGTDAALFVDVSRGWDTLTPEIQAALQPFVLRPTEAGSYWHPPAPPGLVPRGIEEQSVECPFVQGGDVPDWRSTESDHFVVWSCGFGDPNTDVDAAKRTWVAGVAEEVWAAMVPETGAPKPDSYAAGPAPQNRVDVYVVPANLCKRRQGSCAPIPLGDDGEPVLAAVGSAPPCNRGAGGALTSSSYMIVDRERVTAPPAGGPWPFRYTFAHEFFHVIANSLNLEAQGGGCASDRPTENVTSWLVEASAEWAAGAYFPADGPDDRAGLFRAFQKRPATISLRSLAGALPYEAFIYPFFVQQETSRTAFVDFWKQSGPARTAIQLDDRLNATLPFAEKFRHFAVRNFNTTAAELPGDPLPLAERHQQQDAAIPENVRPIVLEPAVTLAAPTEISRPASMAALASQYERYVVGEGTKHVRVDVQGLGNSAFVQLDVIANVKGTWERRSLPGLVFEFCRDEPADDIGEFYLVLSHHDRRPDLQATGGYQVRTRTTCPSGWSGTIDYLLTIGEHEFVSDVSGTTTTDDHEREEQSWSVRTSTPASPEGPQFDEIELAWSGRVESQRTVEHVPSPQAGCVGQVVHGHRESAGTGSGMDRAQLVPSSDGVYFLSPTLFEISHMEGTTSFGTKICNGATGGGSEPLGLYNDQFLAIVTGIPGLAMLQPDENDPNRFRGSHVLVHSEEPRPGGFERIDLTVRWDIRRR